MPRADRKPHPPPHGPYRRGTGAALSIEILVFMAAVCASFRLAHGALGFGFPLVATPLAALAVDMKSTITVLAPVTLVLVVISVLRGGRVRRFWFLPLGIAIRLGTHPLLAAPPPFTLSSRS